ncbi:hypothetical protein [Robertkochia sediminum]|uniref:hypothetical protein n=1 Tax=Robertkochia sediminum TaxID=2785326 RepID=UPI001934A4B8|nr:hypothetical protein [Robertkochia sediminum]MBL7471357.1 hypothetical protein [Robertkochia sediminum]
MSATGSLITKFNRALRPSNRRTFGESRSNATLKFKDPKKKKGTRKTVPELRLKTIKRQIQDQAKSDRIKYWVRFTVFMVVMVSLAVWVLVLLT